MNKNAELLKLDTCDVINDKVTHNVHTAESLGIRKYKRKMRMREGCVRGGRGEGEKGMR